MQNLSLSWARQQRGLTQAGLAAMCGRTQAAITRYERGVRAVPADVLIHIANALELTDAETLSLLRWAADQVKQRRAPRAPRGGEGRQ